MASRAAVFSASSMILHTDEVELKERVPSITELDDIDLLVKTYRPRLLRYVAFSIGDQDVAQTITQDCLLKAYNGRESFRGDWVLSTWLSAFRIT